MIDIKLSNLAKKLGKSASEIARDTGINRNTINALIKGRVEDVKFSTLEKICKTYGIQMNEIISDEDSADENNKKTALKSDLKLYKQEAEAIPFTCWPWTLAAGTFKLAKKGKIINFGELNLYTKKDYGMAYWDFNSLRSLAEYFYETYSEKEQYSKLYSKYLTYSSKIEDSYLRLHEMAPEEVDESHVISIFEKIRHAYRGFWESSLFIDAFDTGVDQEKIAQIAKEKNLNKKDVGVLTTPSEMTFADERKLALFTLIKNEIGLDGDKNLKKEFNKNSIAVKQYINKFDYHKSNYVYVKHITPEEVEEEIRTYITDKELFKKELKKLENYKESKELDSAAVLKKYHLHENPLWFFSGLTYWREHRKKINLMGIHVLDYILSIIENRTGIPKKHLHYLSFDEVENVLKGLIPSKILEKRHDNGVLITVSGDEYKMFEAEEADSIRADLENILSGETNKSKTIIGQTASQGYAKGIARIILTQEDFPRFNEGDVLVTSMTRPEFVILMKRAAAIVTNEGGITCHAAIVSRELGKPCVIATKNATQLIKDGDLVEVRANHATVRILDK